MDKDKKINAEEKIRELRLFFFDYSSGMLFGFTH